MASGGKERGGAERGGEGDAGADDEGEYEREANGCESKRTKLR